MPPTKRNEIVGRVVGVVLAVALITILGLSFANQTAQAKHNSACGPHGKINTQLATLKTDVNWIRKHLEAESE